MCRSPGLRLSDVAEGIEAEPLDLDAALHGQLDDLLPGDPDLPDAGSQPGVSRGDLAVLIVGQPLLGGDAQLKCPSHLQCMPGENAGITAVCHAADGARRSQNAMCTRTVGMHKVHGGGQTLHVCTGKLTQFQMEGGSLLEDSGQQMHQSPYMSQLTSNLPLHECALACCSAFCAVLGLLAHRVTGCAPTGNKHAGSSCRIPAIMQATSRVSRLLGSLVHVATPDICVHL